MSHEPAIRTEGLTRIFRSGDCEISLLHKLALDVYQGDFIAVTGATGSGKTTLMNLLAGLDRPTEGRVYVNNQDLSKLTNDQLAELRLKNVGIVFQNSSLVSDMTVLENVELPLVLTNSPEHEREKRALNLIDLMGISEKAGFYPCSLSIGESRKVAIARALITQPSILLLDEPMGNVDRHTLNILFPLLRGLRYLHDRTIVVATNNAQLAELASQEVHLKKPRFLKANNEIGG